LALPLLLPLPLPLLPPARDIPMVSVPEKLVPSLSFPLNCKDNELSSGAMSF
jgi:hypothetical protein